MKKKILTILALALAVIAANAQEQPKKWYDNIKFSGYGMLQYQWQDPYKVTTDEAGNVIAEKNESNTFKLRLCNL